MTTKLTTARLNDLQRMAELARLSAGSGIGITAPELLELIRVYRERVIDLDELGPAGGEAFLGAMMGGFAGGMLQTKLRELKAPKELCAATRGGRRCTLRAGHHQAKHSWGPLPGKPKKGVT